MTSDLRGEAGWCGGRSTSGGGYRDPWVREPAPGVRRRGGHDRLPGGVMERVHPLPFIRTAALSRSSWPGVGIPGVGLHPTGRRLVRLEPKTPDREAGPLVPLLAGLPGWT